MELRSAAGIGGLRRLALAAVLLAAAALHAGDGDALAIVNGQPVTRGELVDLLMKSHGLAALQQTIALRLARDEARRLNLPVSEADVQAEFQHALERIAPTQGAKGETLSPQQRRQALEIILEQKGISMAEFMIGMERNAHLRKIIERDFAPDEATLREEFARTYGERVEVRHIQAHDHRTLQEAVTQLSGGVPFEDVARKLSQNPETAARGGLMAPFSFDDPAVPAVLREAAFALRPGEVSNPVRAESRIHILRLERRIAPENVRFEDVREQVAQRLRDRVLPQKMNDLLLHLFKAANIRVIDSQLKPRYEELLRRNAVVESMPGTP